MERDERIDDVGAGGGKLRGRNPSLFLGSGCGLGRVIDGMGGREVRLYVRCERGRESGGRWDIRGLDQGLPVFGECGERVQSFCQSRDRVGRELCNMDQLFRLRSKSVDGDIVSVGHSREVDSQVVENRVGEERAPRDVESGKGVGRGWVCEGQDGRVKRVDSVRDVEVER